MISYLANLDCFDVIQAADVEGQDAGGYSEINSRIMTLWAYLNSPFLSKS
jgi:hypothetical protein